MSYGIIHSTLIIVDHVNCWMYINLSQSYYFSAAIQRYPVDFTFIKICDRVTGQHDRQWKILSGQIAILAGHCSLTGRYFQPCNLLHENNKIHLQGNLVEESFYLVARKGN